MMISKASLHHLRQTPRKLRYVADLVRKKPVADALTLLVQVHRRASEPIRKLILSASDSAVKNRQISVERQRISKIEVGEAGMWKRWRSMSMGRAGMIRKRLAHVWVELEEIRGAVPVSLAQEAGSKNKQAKMPKAAAGQKTIQKKKVAVSA